MQLLPAGRRQARFELDNKLRLKQDFHSKGAVLTVRTEWPKSLFKDSADIKPSRILTGYYGPRLPPSAASTDRVHVSSISSLPHSSHWNTGKPIEPYIAKLRCRDFMNEA
jgi:hypothetical protein